MFKASGKLKTSPTWGKSIEKHQNTSKFSENRGALQYFGRLPIEIKPDLHEKIHASRSRRDL